MWNCRTLTITQCRACPPGPRSALTRRATAPWAVFSAKNAERARLRAVVQSRTTHAAQACLDACALFVAQLVDALNGADKEGVMRQRVLALSPAVLFISAGEWKTKAREQIK